MIAIFGRDYEVMKKQKGQKSDFWEEWSHYLPFMLRHCQTLLGSGEIVLEFSLRGHSSGLQSANRALEPLWGLLWQKSIDKGGTPWYFSLHKGPYATATASYNMVWQIDYDYGPAGLKALVFWGEAPRGKQYNALRSDLKEALTFFLRFLELADKEAGGRKRTQQLYESEQLLESVLESQSDLLCRFTPDTRLSYVNLAYARFFGFEKEELIGRKFLDLVPETYHAEIKERLQLLGPLRPRQVMQHSVMDADGNWHWLEWTDHAIFDADSKVLEFQSVGRDLTQLEQQASEYRHLFESMKAGVVYQATDGTIIQCNKAAEEILGLSRDQIQGRSSLDPNWRAIRADGTDFPGEEHPAMRALKTGLPVEEELMGIFNPRCQKVVWIQVTAVPEFDAAQKVTKVLATFSDITREHETLRQLDRQKSLMAELSWQQSHLFRSPLARIMALCEKDSKVIDEAFSFDAFRATVLQSAQEMDAVLKQLSVELEKASKAS